MRKLVHQEANETLRGVINLRPEEIEYLDRNATEIMLVARWMQYQDSIAMDMLGPLFDPDKDELITDDQVNVAVAVSTFALKTLRATGALRK